ncbi:MAG TPA: hypothetical protein VMV00_00840 [Candidatus Baltobacteraceae bacterium]|nr:hypothetical protein [Candidatus Baltobacteraceae bacterium]
MTDMSEIKKEIVIARLRVMASNRRIAVGDRGSFSRDQLIKEVEADTDIGKMMVEIQMAFLKAVKDGKMYAAIT